MEEEEVEELKEDLQSVQVKPVELTFQQTKDYYDRNKIPYIAFEWASGFVVISQKLFNKLSPSKKKLLLEPLLHKVKRKSRKKVSV